MLKQTEPLRWKKRYVNGWMLTRRDWRGFKFPYIASFFVEDDYVLTFNAPTNAEGEGANPHKMTSRNTPLDRCVKYSVEELAAEAERQLISAGVISSEDAANIRAPWRDHAA